MGPCLSKAGDGAADASTAGKAYRTAPGDDVRNDIVANTTRSAEMTGGSTGIPAEKAGDQAVISPADDSQKAGREPRGDGQANTIESNAQTKNEGGMKEATSVMGQIHLEVDEQTGRRLSRLSGDSFASEASTATRMDEPTKLTDSVVKSSVKMGEQEYKQLNQYIIVKDLGRGVHAKVMLGLNAADNLLYAIKATNSNAAVAETAVRKEIAVLKKLKHPNVLKLFEVIDDAKTNELLLVLEFASAGPIFTRYNMVPVKENRLLSYIRDIIQGLDYLHHVAGIAHMDLKPENLLKSGDGTVKIADFGVSFIGKANTKNSNKRIVGTPAFIAPEMLGEDGYDPFAADIWSLGVCIFHMATARLPFTGRTIFQIIAMAKRQGLQFPEKPDLSAELKDLLMIVLKTEPEERASLEDVMTHAWTTKNGSDPLPPSLKQSAKLTVTEEEIADAVRMDPLAALLRPNFKTEKFGAGEVIMRKGEIGDTLYFINVGECEVLVDALHDEIAEQTSDITSQDEAEHLGVLAVRGEGVVVGEIAVLETILRMQSDGDKQFHGRRTASVRARGNVECLSVTVEELFAALEQDEEGKDRLFRTANDRLEQNTEVLLQIAESKKDSLHPVVDTFSPRRMIHVLYAEDSVPTQFIIKRLVNRIHDIELVCVNDGKAALDYCINAKDGNKSPDIILMDCQMPVMDGLQATREIRKLDDPILSRVPIIAVSSGIKSMNEKDCMDAGMDDYVAKPLNQQALTNILVRNIPTSLMQNPVDTNDIKLMQELMISDEMV
mmetsp:Transcript_4805/g.19756  ORF Transcript_4805/g.19756 Transcript_4805/m.19756 type:complete len:779 (-) Transcript_4805:2716-5052(-)